jgi:glycosyltransferase involved in cell wall biosynthesis
MELVTIILTTLNSERFVARSIESCLNQTHSELELLVVDGGSRDRTLEIVAEYNDPRVRVVHQQDNAGKLPGAINVGMAHASGDYITWTQDDSWYEPNAVQVMLEYLVTHPEVALVYTDYWEVNEHENPIRYQEVNTPDHLLRDDVVRQCFLFRREVYERVGPQETKYFPVHEIPWRMQVAEHFEIAPLHVPLLYYTVHAGSLTGRIGNRALRRMVADIFLEQGRFDRHAYRRRLAEIDITQAYEEYKMTGNYCAFYRYALAGIWQDWHWLRNYGLLKLMCMSLVPNRDRHRDKLLSRWSKDGSVEEPD